MLLVLTLMLLWLLFRAWMKGGILGGTGRTTMYAAAPSDANPIPMAMREAFVISLTSFLTLTLYSFNQKSTEKRHVVN
jgi:hypothetical protein